MTLAELRDVVILACADQRRHPRRARAGALRGGHGRRHRLRRCDRPARRARRRPDTRRPSAARARSARRSSSPACSPATRSRSRPASPSSTPSPSRSTGSRSSPRRSRPSGCVTALSLLRRPSVAADPHPTERNTDMNRTPGFAPDPARADGAGRFLQRPRRARRLERHDAHAHGNAPAPRRHAGWRRPARRSRCAPTCASSGRTTSPGRAWRSSASRRLARHRGDRRAAAAEPDRHRQRGQALLRQGGRQRADAAAALAHPDRRRCDRRRQGRRQAKLADAQARWEENADDIAGLLNSVNPRYWKLARDEGRDAHAPDADDRGSRRQAPGQLGRATSPPTTGSTTTSSTCRTCSRTGSSSSSRSGSARRRYVRDVGRPTETARHGSAGRLAARAAGGVRLPAAARGRDRRDTRYDLHALIELVERGCPPELAVRILAPLDEGDAA